MEKSNQHKFCAWIKGNGLERQSLSAEFGKFGKITKIFVSLDGTLGKVYLDNYSDLRKACVDIRRDDWKIEYKKDPFQGKQNSESNGWKDNSRNNYNSDSFDAEPTSSYQGGPSEFLNNIGTRGPSSVSMAENFEEFSPSVKSLKNARTEDKVRKVALTIPMFGNTTYEFVDAIGRPVEVLENEEGDFFINLKDVRRNGFMIFRKSEYENVIITRVEDLREFESFLLNQGCKYLLEHKKTFDENEVYTCIEKVKNRLWSGNDKKEMRRSVVQGNNNNIQITTSNRAAAVPENRHPGPSGDAINRPPKLLADNFKPSVNQFKPEPKRGRGGTARERTDSKGIGFTRVPDQSSMRKPKVNGVKKEEGEETWEVDSSAQKTSRPLRSETKNSAREHKGSDSASVTSGLSELARLSIERESLPISENPYKVMVCYSKERPSKGKVYYVQLVDNLPTIENLLVNVNQLAPSQKDVSPVKEGIYLVQFEGVWYRCLMIHPNPDKCYVELIDYGNKERLTGPFKEMPDELKKVAAQSIRIVPDDSFKVNWKPDDEIEIVVKKHYEDGTHIVGPSSGCHRSSKPQPSTIQNQPKPAAPTVEKPLPKQEPEEPVQKAYFHLPPPFATTKVGDEVKILGYLQEKFFLMSKECLTHRKLISQYIQQIPHHPLNKVEEKQLVLCSHESRPHLHRGIVTKVDGNLAHIQYLDFAGEEAQLSVKSLRNVDAHLAEKPRAVLDTAVFSALKSLSPKAEEYLNTEIINKGMKLVVAENQDLKLDGKQLLSEVIKNIDLPPPEPKKVEPAPAPTAGPQEDLKPSQPSTINQTAGPIMFDSMPYFSVKPGPGAFVAFSCEGASNINLISTSEESVQYMAQLEITPPDDKPYKPEALEMCLVLFEDSWYRATVTDLEGDQFDMLFVDFGNTYTVGPDKIRRISKELADIPIIGLTACFEDLPKDNPQIDAKLKELIPDQTELEDVTVISVPDNVESFQYTIRVPSITKQLKDAGLL